MCKTSTWQILKAIKDKSNKCIVITHKSYQEQTFKIINVRKNKLTNAAISQLKMSSKDKMIHHGKSTH